MFTEKKQNRFFKTKIAPNDPNSYMKRCGICEEKVLPNDSKTHSENKHKHVRAACLMCYAQFSSTLGLFMHVQLNHAFASNTKLPCSQCNYAFQDPFVLKKHIESVHGVKNAEEFYFQCVFCSETQQDFNDFTWHVHKHQVYTSENAKSTKIIKTDLKSIRKSQCHFCSEVIEGKLYDHIKATHKKPQPISQDLSMVNEVPFDNREVKTVTEVKIMTHNKNSNPQNDDGEVMQITDRYFCNFCDFVGNGYYEYEDHLLSKPENHETICPFCKKAFVIYFQEHLSKFHGTTRKRQFRTECVVKDPASYTRRCGICEDKILADDTKAHAENKHKTVVAACPICNAQFLSTLSLFKHVQLNHAFPNDKKLHCSECSYAFQDPFVLKKHIEQVHKVKNAEEFSFQCIICPETQEDFKHFTWHVHKHQVYKSENGKSTNIINTGLKSMRKIQCHYCSKIIQGKLHDHIRAVHRNSQPSSKRGNVEYKLLLHHKNKDTGTIYTRGLNKSKEKYDKELVECMICFAVMCRKQSHQHASQHALRGTKSKITFMPSSEVNFGEKSSFVNCTQCYCQVRTKKVKEHAEVHKMEASCADQSISTASKKSRKVTYTNTRNSCSKKGQSATGNLGKLAYHTNMSNRRESFSFATKSLPTTTTSTFNFEPPSYLGNKMFQRCGAPSIECPKCDLLIEKDKFEDHFMQHQKKHEAKCPDCGMLFDSAENVVKHVKSAHMAYPNLLVGRQGQMSSSYGHENMRLSDNTLQVKQPYMPTRNMMNQNSAGFWQDRPNYKQRQNWQGGYNSSI